MKKFISFVAITAMMIANLSGLYAQPSGGWVYAVVTASITMPGSTTYYSGGAYRSPSASPTEAAVWFDFPTAQVASRLYVVTTTAQPASGAVTITVRRNGIDSLLTITVPAGASAGVFQDTTNTVTYNPGDTFSVSIVNTTPVGVVSAKITEIALGLSGG